MYFERNFFDKYWSKYPPWKQSNYDCDKKSHAHGYFHGKFGAIERLNLLRALTPLLCQSHRDKCFWNFMSSLYIVLFSNFYVTIWCKDNKLIIYLSKKSHEALWKPLPWQSHRDKRLWNRISSLYVILLYNLFVPIWCKDNKLIFYLSR